MNWCCDGFHDAASHTRERGFFIYVLPPVETGLGYPSFRIVYRSVDSADVAVLQSAAKDLPIKINIHTQTGLKFCPWCGVELRTFYSESYPEFIDYSIINEFKST